MRPSPDAEGYLMIESIDINNFRCFEAQALKGLGRINVVVGRNASGKTALLEAIYLNLGSPALSLKVRGWRGLLGSFQITDDADAMNMIWKDYFYRFEQERVASIAFRGSQGLNRKLTIRCDPVSGVRLSKDRVAIGDEASAAQVGTIAFEWWQSSRRIAAAKPILEGETIKIKGGPQSLPGAFYSSTNPINPQETANWFSDLSKRREERIIVQSLQSLFPFINDLSVETHGTMPMVHADVLSLPEKIPVGLISSGVNKLVALLVAIATQKHGTLIIDEIENGFHFRAMPGIWQCLYEFCKQSSVQLFVSTHSQECLESLKQVIKGHERDFSLLRTVRENEGCIIRQFNGDKFLGALEEDIELRS